MVVHSWANRDRAVMYCDSKQRAELKDMRKAFFIINHLDENSVFQESDEPAPPDRPVEEEESAPAEVPWDTGLTRHWTSDKPFPSVALHEEDTREYRPRPKVRCAATSCERLCVHAEKMCRHRIAKRP